MQHVVTGLFDTQSEAERAKQKLMSAGVNPDQITLVPGAHRIAGQSVQSQPEPKTEGGFWDTLKQLFMPEEDRHSYAEGLRRGAVMLSVRADENRVPIVEDILEGAGAMDMEEREDFVASGRVDGLHRDWNCRPCSSNAANEQPYSS